MPLMLAMLLSATWALGADAFETVRDDFDTAPVWAEFWSRADPAFRVASGRLVASDGGVANSLGVVLTKRSFRDFVMQWTMVRLADKGDERAQLVVGVNEKGDCAPENTLWLEPKAFQIGQPYSLRLVVLNGEATVARQRLGETREERVLVKKVPAAGRVGFRHYCRYEYAYDDLAITAIGDGATPAPERAPETTRAGPCATRASRRRTS